MLNPVADEAWFSQLPVEGEVVATSPWNVRQLFSTEKTGGRGDWETPAAVFHALDKKFAFELDACASHDNTLCDSYFTEEDDGLSQCWIAPDSFSARGNAEFRDFLTIWCNPPYGRDVGKWVEKAYRESQEGCTVVMLVMASTDTRWWKDWVWKAAEVRFITGRLKFTLDGFEQNSSPKGSAIVIFTPWSKGPPAVSLMERPEKG